MSADDSAIFTMGTRRQMAKKFAALLAASPLMAQQTGMQALTHEGPDAVPPYNMPLVPPVASYSLADVVNVFDFRDLVDKYAPRNISQNIDLGVEDEISVRANRAAYSRVWLRPRTMIDVSQVDTSIELLGQKLDSPIMMDPTGGKAGIPDGDHTAALGARDAKTLYSVATTGDWMNKLHASNSAPTWWSNSYTLVSKQVAVDFAKRSVDTGCCGFILTSTDPWNANRDRNLHLQAKANPEKFRGGGRMTPFAPELTWEVIEWIRVVSDLPIIIKGVLDPDDAELAVAKGAQAIVCSNTGGRGMDGAMATLEALPALVKAVNGRIPVLLDGGIRRGDDILKGLALGATAVLCARPYVWGLGAFGREGVVRTFEMLKAELKTAMALAGVPNLASIPPDLVQRVWQPPQDAKIL